uniref:Uncharacterized protein n=1 Tax=Ovis aries TaxID=9940 RepID=A0AC11D3M1_SHEEP
RGCGEKGTLKHCWWECKLVQLLWRTEQRFLRKLKIELPLRSSNRTPEHISRENQNLKIICTPMFTATPFTIAKTQKRPKCPSTDEWMKKM